MGSFRVLLVDDHPVVRAGVLKLLEGLPDIDVVGEAENGRQAVELTASLKPDVVFMDITMPELNGLEAAEMIGRDLPEVHVIMLSVHTDFQYVVRALRQAGASGYVLKDARPDEYRAAIQAVTNGGVYLGPHIAKTFLEHASEDVGNAVGPLGQMTLRQRETLQLIAEGKRNKEIADILNVSVKTVETHRANVMQMLDIHDVAGLVRFAIRSGLVSADN
ncbi:MAG: response regulator transcription factor [Rhodothermales bacterium]|nr:response regulator transcription factor [Rhodothermales bacterium]